MPVSVTMPRLGESVTEGTVTRWLKQEGDRVEADEPLLEVSTDKVDTEIPAPATGVLSRIVVHEDEVAEVGSELAVIAGDGDDGGTPGAAPAQDAPRHGGGQADAERPADTAQPAGTAQPATAPDAITAPEAATPAPDAGTGAGTPVTLPALGESVTEGTVTRWLKQVGDPVQADEPLLEVSTDKVDTEIPAPVTGTVLEIRVAQDETVEVGTTLAVIGTAGAPAAATAPAPAPSPAPAAQPARTAPAVPAAPVPAATDPVAPVNGVGAGYVTPLVRKLAQEHHVDLVGLTGTGVGGRIRKQDVLAAAEAARAAAEAAARQAAQPAQPAPVPKATPAVTPSPLRGRTEKLTRMRALIARRMVESLQVSAQLTTVVEVDVTRIARLRDATKAEFARREGVKLSFLPFFALAAVEALRVHPNVNASIDLAAGTVTYHDAEHLGMAVDTDRGLMVPVVRNAGDLNLSGLARRIADLAERTRTNKVTPDELSGGTFTLTNTGSRGALFDTPIINQPQVAILGTGTVVKRAMVIDDPELGEIIVPRSMVYLALSYDHRLVDGADAMRFLGTMKERLEAGAFEAEVGL